jgi:ketosteroid isomerase-like protein
MRYTLPLLLLAVVPWGLAVAQNPTEDEQRVRALDDQERIAARSRDIPALERLWSEQFTVNAPNNQVVAGREAVLRTFVRSGIIDFARFDRQIELIRVDGTYVTIMGLEIIEPRSDAPSASLSAGRLVRRRFTNIWRKEADTWRLFIRHANVIPDGGGKDKGR